MALTLSSQIRRNPELMHAPANEELVMLSVAAGNYYSLDPVGRRIWEMAEEPIRLNELCSCLMREFEVDQSVCEKDMLEFVAQLRVHDIVEVLCD